MFFLKDSKETDVQVSDEKEKIELFAEKPNVQSLEEHVSDDVFVVGEITPEMAEQLEVMDKLTIHPREFTDEELHSEEIDAENDEFIEEDVEETEEVLLEDDIVVDNSPKEEEMVDEIESIENELPIIPTEEIMEDVKTENVPLEELYTEKQPTVPDESEVAVSITDEQQEIVIEIAAPTLNKARNRRRKKKKH